MKGFRNAFKNGWDGKTPRMTEFYDITVTKQIVKEGVTVVEVTVPFSQYMSPIEGKSKRIVGKTRCMKSDTYDRQKGLDIAEHKAMAKAYKYIEKVFLENASRFMDYSQSCQYMASYVRKKAFRQAECFREMGKLNEKWKMSF